MKKKFRITEEQARKIMNFSEATQQSQQTQQSQDPCDVFNSTMVPSSIQAQMSQHGDIDCCRMLNGDFGPVYPGNGNAPTTMLQSHCDVAWSIANMGGTFLQGNQLGGTNLWAPCCDPDHTSGGGPCPHGQIPATDPACIECQPGVPSTYTPATGPNCMCCKDERTNTSSKCDRCDDPGEFRLNGQCIKCIEDVNNPGCCKGQSTVSHGDDRWLCEGGTCHNHPSGTYTSQSACENNCGRSNTGNGEGCSDDVCPNPNHVKTPYNPNGTGCKCECPEGAGEKGCNTAPYGNWNKEECCCADKKGNCDPKSVVGPVFTENRRLAPAETKDQKELREEMTRIKELLK